MSDSSKPSILERAFQLARDGQCHTMTDLRRALKAERYDNIDSHLAGSSITRQLQKLMKAVR